MMWKGEQIPAHAFDRERGPMISSSNCEILIRLQFLRHTLCRISAS